MATGTKYKPIIMGAESVRAILAGHKTQTRRAVKVPAWAESVTIKRADSVVWAEVAGRHPDLGGCAKAIWCPYGVPGDRLWVRETWFEEYDPETCRPYDPPRACHRATYDGDVEPVVMDGDGFTEYRKNGWQKSPWRSPRHMPRWASRLTLEITGVRVERVQDISHEDAIAEGCEGSRWVASSPYFAGPHTDDGELPQEEFEQRWNEINKAHPWASNPWVWCLEFRRVDP